MMLDKICKKSGRKESFSSPISNIDSVILHATLIYFFISIFTLLFFDLSIYFLFFISHLLYFYLSIFHTLNYVYYLVQ